MTVSKIPQFKFLKELRLLYYILHSTRTLKISYKNILKQHKHLLQTFVSPHSLSNFKDSNQKKKMVYSYTPTYYSTLHDSITSLCKSILPFSFKRRCLPAADQKLAKLQSDNLKWQQDSFHQMLKLMGLHNEGILAENEVSDFKTHLLDTLIASPLEHEHQVILRDKLLFLQVRSS